MRRQIFHLIVRQILLVLMLLGMFIPAARAESIMVTTERLAFLQAKTALTRGNYFNYQLLSNRLHSYVLYPYLRYAELSWQIDKTPDATVHAFLKTYADTPLADRMRTRWLTSLAEQQRWQTFLDNYQPTNDGVLECLNVQAFLATDRISKAQDLLSTLWTTSKSLDISCKPAVEAWYKSGKLTPDLAWQRVKLLMTQGQSLNADLLSYLTPAQQTWADLWQRVRHEPALVTNSSLFAQDNDYSDDILKDGIARLAKINPVMAAQAWPKLQSDHDFDEEDQQTLLRAIAIELARSNNPAAVSWLTSIKSSYVNETVRAWRVRTALAAQNWPQVLYWISQLSSNERELPAWRYWYARALENLNRSEEAQPIFQSLANEVNYYGLLASKQLGKNYQPAAITANNENLFEQIKSNPAIQRAYELYNLKMITDARREWQWGIRDMNKQQLQAAAQLAMQWDWYDRALMTAAKAGDVNNIQMRFPLGYRQQVLISAKQWGLDPAWVLGIIRQESAFMFDAKSGVGALGLMQLMPRTAKIMSNRLSSSGLLDATINIQLGCRYLKELYQSFGNNEIVTTAAYNVGPTRLAKWVPLAKTLPADIWVDILPWQETRDYVQTVMLAKSIYEKKLTQPI